MMEVILLFVVIFLLLTFCYVLHKRNKKTLDKYHDTYDLYKLYESRYNDRRKELTKYYMLFLGKGDTILVDWPQVHGNKRETYEKVESVNPDDNFIKLDSKTHGSHWCQYEWIVEIITAREDK